MWTKDNIVRNGNRIALFVVQLLIFFACILYIDYIYITNILPDRRVRQTFIKTSCVIDSKKLNTEGGLISGYRADFQVVYKAINGKEYKQWTYGNGLDSSFTQTSSGPSSMLSKYEVGGTYTCYYDGASPEIVVLVLRQNWLSIFPIMFPALIMLLMFYLLMRDVIRFIKK